MFDNLTNATSVCDRIRVRRHVGFVAALSGLVPVVLVAGDAQACRDIPLCATIDPDFEDEPFGTIPGSPWPARGVRVEIIRPYPEPPLGLYLDEDGCTTFESQFHTGFRFLVYPEAILGSENNIRIKAFDLAQDDTRPELVIADPLTDEAGMLVFEIPTSEVWSIMAGAVHVVHRLDSAAQLGTSPFAGSVHELEIYRTGEPNSSAFQTFSAGQNAHNHKFVIGHEIGHWVQGRANAGLGLVNLWNFNYGYDVQEEECDFVVANGSPGTLNSHGIRSAEHSSGALTEGFAHFVAAVAFNDVGSETGIFRYYKEVNLDFVPDYADLVNSNYQVELQGGDTTALGGQSAWVENECTTDFAYPLSSSPTGQEVTSEIDWMRFFWALLTKDEIVYGTAMEFWDVTHLMAYTHDIDPWGVLGSVYCNLLNSLADNGSGLDSFEDRFTDITEENGVFYDMPSTCAP